MSRKIMLFLLGGVFLFSSLPVLAQEQAAEEEPVQPVPHVADLNLDQQKVDLGRLLFHDARLSKDGTLSCASCHNPKTGGTIEGVITSVSGASGKTVPINIPSVLNSGLDTLQFWNGRADTLEAQADGPLENPDEMGANWPDVLAYLNGDPVYKPLFAKIYGGAAERPHVEQAMAEYERSLLTPDGPFDRYLNGDEAAVSAQVKQGYAKFKEFGCAACHAGPNLGGSTFMTMNEQYFTDRGTPVIDQDLGRFTVTEDEADKFMFRVPPLRNVAVTGPYLHDGQAKTLEEAVEIMARYQLGMEEGELKAEDRDAIVAFLMSLNGEVKP